MPRLLYAETRHSPAEYHWSAQEFAEIVSWDAISDWLVDYLDASDFIERAMEIYDVAQMKDDDTTKEAVMSWLSDSLENGAHELGYKLWMYDKTAFGNEIEVWAKEQEEAQ